MGRPSTWNVISAWNENWYCFTSKSIHLCNLSCQAAENLKGPAECRRWLLHKDCQLVLVWQLKRHLLICPSAIAVSAWDREKMMLSTAMTRELCILLEGFPSQPLTSVLSHYLITTWHQPHGSTPARICGGTVGVSLWQWDDSQLTLCHAFPWAQGSVDCKHTLWEWLAGEHRSLNWHKLHN